MNSRYPILVAIAVLTLICVLYALKGESSAQANQDQGRQVVTFQNPPGRESPPIGPKQDGSRSKGIKDPIKRVKTGVKPPEQLYKAEVQQYWSYRDHVNKNSIRKARFDYLYREDAVGYALISKDILTNRDLKSLSALGDQAVARIFAVRYLEYMLGLGEPRIAIETIAALADQVGLPDTLKGKELDLEQLLTAYLIENFQSFLYNYEKELDELGLNSSNVLIFDTAIGLAAIKNGKPDSIDQIFTYIHDKAREQQ